MTTTAAPVHHRLPRPWGEQHVVDTGGDGPVVVLVHGWPEHWEAWREVMPPLAAAGRRVVAVDLRGMGWSTATIASVAGVRVEDLADDILLALADLAIDEPVVLAGHDWGGIVAFRFALDHPEQLRHVVAFSAVPPWLSRRAMRRHVGDWLYTVFLALFGGPVVSSRRVLGALFRLSTWADVWNTPDGRAALASYRERLATPAGGRITRRLYGRFLRHDLWRWTGERPPPLEVPATLLSGEHETITRPSLFAERSHPGEVRVVPVLGARHWVPEERPDAVVDALLAVSS